MTGRGSKHIQGERCSWPDRVGCWPPQEDSGQLRRPPVTEAWCHPIRPVTWKCTCIGAPQPTVLILGFSLLCMSLSWVKNKQYRVKWWHFTELGIRRPSSSALCSAVCYPAAGLFSLPLCQTLNGVEKWLFPSFLPPRSCRGRYQDNENRLKFLLIKFVFHGKPWFYPGIKSSTPMKWAWVFHQLVFGQASVLFKWAGKIDDRISEQNSMYHYSEYFLNRDPRAHCLTPCLFLASHTFI